MGDIKRMPEAIRSSVRSAIILFDLSRVVEELIFNSLDAGATKISIAVSVETCYLKVADNGCGITRDGLVLLAERYATSKFDQLADSHAVARSFGFCGEALSSIANVSLLEVLTKAHGRPNGYRKVMKGSKCLYIGIDDGRQDVGTTVIVRDLFYNQPVRRKLIHSRTKKVLESVKKCVFRISLVHPKVSFRVVDLESDDELFCTTPSSSPLSRLKNGYGVEVTNSLHELNVTDGVMTLSGYVSSPCNISSVKTFQFIYINARYISKGTIHKLLNQLASGFNSSEHQKGNGVAPIAKQGRIRTCSTFILNLCCPRCLYDITFEPSKTSVDFKDWKPIIGFIEKAITRSWAEIVSHDALSDDTGVHVLSENVQIEAGHVDSPGEDFPKKLRTEKRKSRVQNNASPIGFPCPYLDMQTEKHDLLNCLKGNKTSSHGITYQSDSSFKPFDESPAIFKVDVDRESDSCDWRADYNVFSSEETLAVNKFFSPVKYKKQVDYISESSFDVEHIDVGTNLTNEYLKIDIPRNSFGIENMDILTKACEKPFLKSSTSRKRRILDEESRRRFVELDESLTNEYIKRDLRHNVFEIGNVDNMSENFEKPFLQSCVSQKRQGLDEESLLRSEELDFPVEHFRYKRTCNVLTELDFPLGNPVKPFLCGGDFDGENDLLIDSDSVSGSKSHDFGYDLHENLRSRYQSSSKYDYLADSGSMNLDFHFDDIVWSTSSREQSSLFNGVDTYSDFKMYARTKEKNFEFHPQHNIFDVTFPRSSDMFKDEIKWLSLDLPDGNYHAITSHHKLDNDKDQKSVKENVRKQRSRRSHSAPPFYQGKKKLFALNKHLVLETGKCKYQSNDDSGTSQEVGELRHSKRSSAVCLLDSRSNSTKALLVHTRERKKGPNTHVIEKVKSNKKLESLRSKCMTSVKDPVSTQLKWRQGNTKTANVDKSHNPRNEDAILDVSTGLLHLAGDTLVPESLGQNFLKDAQVLQQVDKKFIPVAGDGILAIIDQHAADERIRLEELRQKVLSGEEKKITYLDTEQKLVMPEIGYQLLHSYAEQIQNWGWLCNFHSQDSRSFRKNLNILHEQPTGITLVAVPCILGVNLTEVDLLEFLQQLADTDGSSTIPPSVHRVLNSKACRGAIMFGDTLLPSECSLIVEELKQTSLCFQCAHGRPTTVPLVNLDALHKQVEKLRSWNENSDPWHGLRRHVPSLERATSRLSLAEVH